MTMINEIVQSSDVDMKLSLGSAEIYVSIAYDYLGCVRDITFCGSARLELYARSRDNGDSLAERDIALFLPVQAFPLSTAHPPALKSLRDFSSLANLASALTSKFEQLGAVDHMTKSIKPHLRALQLSSSDHPVRETRSSSPAISLRMSFEHHDNLNTLAEAIQLHHEALRLSAIGHPFRAQSLVSLGLCLFIQDTDLFDLNRRIILMFEAPSNSPASIGGRLRIALHDVRAVERDQQGEARRQFDMQVEVLVAKIRAFSGLKRFMMPKAFDFLVASLPLGFIVIVNTSEFACHAILLSRTLGVARVLKLQAPLGGFRFRDIWFVCGFENEPYSLGLNLLVEFIILTIPRRRLVVLSELDADQGEQRNLLADLVGRLWNGNGECSLVVQVKILPAHRASDAKLVIASGPLATSLHAPHPSTRDTPVLVEVLEFDKEGLRLRPEGYLERSLSCGKLANSLWTRFDQTGDTLLLDQALELCREALRLRPEGHLHRASSCGMLAGLLMTRFNQTGNTILLEEALELERETLRSRPEGHLLRASSCVNLAFSLRARFNQTGDTVLLYEALALEREALHLRPKGHSERDRSCTSLAISLITFFNQIGDTRLLDEALDLSKEALRLRPMGHPHRAWSCGNLASSLWTRFQQTGDTALLDEAIELEREALHLRPEGHPHRAHSCGNLADSLRARFTQTGQTLLLDEALHLEREALRLRPEGHPQRALSCGNLADSLQACFQQTGDAALLDEAIELEREALHLRPEGHPHRAYSCGNLADSLRARFTQTGQTSLLDEALELNREALRLRPMGHPYHALSCGHLADSLRTCFRQTGKTALLDEAQSVCSHAIECSEMSPSDNVLLRIQMIHILVLPSVLSYSPSTAVSFLLEAIQHRAGLIPHFYSICDVLRLCVRVAVSDEDNVRLLAVYRVLIEVLPELGSVVLDKVSRLHRWRDAGSLPLEALLHALKVNDLPLGLELLEQGRAVLWSQALAMRAPELQGLTDVWKTKLQTLLRSMSSSAEHGNIPESSLTGRDRAHASYTRLQRLLQEIRASPGLERFMRGPSYPELIQVASSHTVVILATGDTVCHAVIISSASAHPVHLTLESIAASDLEIIGNDIREYDSNVRAMPGLAVATEMRRIYVNGRREDPAQRKLHQALQRLWHGIVKPVLDYLGLEKASGRDRPRLHWCAIGTTVFLPFHAAGVYSGHSLQECCSDYIVSSYTPTLSALHRARANLTPIARRPLVLLAAAASESTASLSMPFLDNVKAEVRDVTRIAQATNHIEVLEYGHISAANVHEVAEALPRADIVHLACHGVQDKDDPLNSGFCLGDGKLTVSELMDVKLDHAFLAFLSACETAKGDKNQPDQAIHLAAAMLFCGFRSVVATMWSMWDDDGPAVARVFYEELLAEEVIDADAVAYALDAAVSQLRSDGVSPSRWASYIHLGA